MSSAFSDVISLSDNSCSAFDDVITSSQTPQRFYMTYARSRPNELVPWIEEHNVPLLTNAIHRWSDNTDRFLDMWEYDTPHVIDAGGYNVMASYVTQSGSLRSDVSLSDVTAEKQSKQLPFYPYTLEEYHEWLCSHSDEIEWATVMDYACEDRFNKLWDYEQRIEKTLEATIRQQNLVDDMPSSQSYKILPVLQGRKPQDYIDCYNRLKAHGVDVDHVGIGTVCRLSSEKRIVEFEQAIRDNTDVNRLHGFGVKIQAFNHGASFESADSQAWVYNASNGEVAIDGDGRLRTIPCDQSLIRTVESFKNYYNYVTRLQQGEKAVEFDSVVDPSLSDDIAVEKLYNEYDEMIS